MDDVHRNDAPVWRIHVVVYAIGRNRMKAILVIEMPKSCAVCPIFQEGIDGYCPIGLLTPSKKYEIAKGCPLKPMPQKMRTDADDIEEDSYCQGWNACIKELEK